MFSFVFSITAVQVLVVKDKNIIFLNFCPKRKTDRDRDDSWQGQLHGRDDPRSSGVNSTKNQNFMPKS